MAERLGKSERTVYRLLQRPEAACFELVPVSNTAAVPPAVRGGQANSFDALFDLHHAEVSSVRAEADVAAVSRGASTRTRLHSSSNAAAAACSEDLAGSPCRISLRRVAPGRGASFHLGIARRSHLQADAQVASVRRTQLSLGQPDVEALSHLSARLAHLQAALQAPAPRGVRAGARNGLSCTTGAAMAGADCLNADRPTTTLPDPPDRFPARSRKFPVRWRRELQC